MQKNTLTSLLVLAATLVTTQALADETKAVTEEKKAVAEECSINVTSDDMMQFNLKEMTVSKKCEEFTVNLSHIGKLAKEIMGHNVVISKTSDVAGIANDGISEGLKNNYLKTDDSRVIAFSPVIGGGEEVSMTFKTDQIDKDGDYSFFCGFPGHSFMMKGKVIVTE